MSASMWDATVSVASSSNFGPDWDDIDIDPNQPNYRAFVHANPLRQKMQLVNTFGRDAKSSEKAIVDDGYALCEAAPEWKNRDQNEKMRSRIRIASRFGKVETIPCPLNYDIEPAAKCLQFRSPKCMIMGKWDRSLIKTDGPGPGAYNIPSGVDIAPVNKILTTGKKKTPGPSIKELRESLAISPGPAAYYHNKAFHKAIAYNIPRPVMPPRKRHGQGRVVLDLKSLDICSNEKYAEKLGVPKLRKEQDKPGPGAYETFDPRPYDNSKVTSTHDNLGERRDFIVGQPELSAVGPGQYEQIYSTFGEFDFRYGPSKEIRGKMKATTALQGNVPWPSLVPKDDLAKIKSKQLGEKHKSHYSYNKKKQSFHAPWGTRTKSTVQNCVQYFDPSKATMKTK